MTDNNRGNGMNEIEAVEILKNYKRYIGIETDIKSQIYVEGFLDVALDIAIAALQEKAERDKGCEYCQTVESDNGRGRVFYKEPPHRETPYSTLDDGNLQIAYDANNGWVLHFEDDEGDVMFDVKISTCPYCGRKLGEG